MKCRVEKVPKPSEINDVKGRFVSVFQDNSFERDRIGYRNDHQWYFAAGYNKNRLSGDPHSKVVTRGALLMGEFSALLKLIFFVLPAVEKELIHWRKAATLMPNEELSRQALASIASKRFHCQGGSVFALYSGAQRHSLVQVIVAYQTISDYLDNLCDRTGVVDERAFRCLHRAMTDALLPVSAFPGKALTGSSGVHPFTDYYAEYPLRSDAAYLEHLVEVCRSGLDVFPGFTVAYPYAAELAHLYIDLQCLKHLDPAVREDRLREWASQVGGDYPEVEWWELAAAAGSTLGVFALMAASARPGFDSSVAEELVRGYFPWICGLHILLDYLIDLGEDAEHGDFNFVACYPDREVAAARLEMFVGKALARAADLPHSSFHRLCVQGLLGLYLSDPKIKAEETKGIAGRLIARGGPDTDKIWRLCRSLRALGVI